MDGLMLLEEARVAGLKVTRKGDRLRIQGPRRAEGVARRLLAHKAAVLAALALDAPGTADDLPADWCFVWEERSAIMQHDGQLSRELAEAAALAEVLDRIRRGEQFAATCNCLACRNNNDACIESK